jgi:hypothetical protein
VQDANAREGLYRAVGHFDRKANGDRTNRTLEKIDQTALQVAQVGHGPVELLARDVKGVQVFGLQAGVVLNHDGTVRWRDVRYDDDRPWASP